MKYVITIMCLVLVTFVSANNVENVGTTGKMEATRSTIEGTTENMDVEATKGVKVSGEYLDLPDGPVYGNSHAPINTADLPNPDDPTSGMTYPFPIEPRDLRKSEPPSYRNESDWGDDILVYDGEVGEGQDFDGDEVTGDLYAIWDTYHTTNDSIIVYRSTDGGETWNFWRATINADGNIGNPKIRIARDAGGQTWVCMFGIWHEPTGDDILYMRRMTPDQTQSAYEQVNSNVSYADVDADIGTAASVYVTYIPEASDFDIWAARNVLAGAGWENDQSLFVDPGLDPYPQIAAGSGGNVAVTFIDDRITTNNEIRIKRSTTSGISWVGSEQVSNNSGAYAISQTDIAYSYNATYSTGWITASFYVVDNHNLVFYYSTDAGLSWTYDGVIGATSGDENLSSLRSRKSTGSLTMIYNQDPGDSTMFTWTSASDPTNLTAPVRVNDYAATGIWGPTAGWVDGSSAILYTSHTTGYNLFFDWYNNTGVEELSEQTISSGLVTLSPNPAANAANLSYRLNIESPVEISVFDATGRLIRTLVNEIQSAGEHRLGLDNVGLAAGIYFVKVTTDQGTETETMTIIR